VIIVDAPTAFQFLLAVVSLVIWVAVLWRNRAAITASGNARALLLILMVAVLLLSEFIPFTAGWYVAGISVTDVLRGLRSGIVLIVGIAFLTLGPSRSLDDD